MGLVRGDHEYGRFAVQGLLKELQGTKVCVAYQEVIPLLYNHQKAQEIMQVVNIEVTNFDISYVHFNVNYCHHSLLNYSVCFLSPVHSLLYASLKR